MSLRIYIAGGSSERESCAAMIAKARAQGLHVTHDWTTSPGDARQLSETEWRYHGHADFMGIKTAHILWCMVPEMPSEGMATELGIALALGRRSILSGPQRPINPFHYLVERRFALHSTALDWVMLEATKYNGH